MKRNAAVKKGVLLTEEGSINESNLEVKAFISYKKVKPMLLMEFVLIIFPYQFAYKGE